MAAILRKMNDLDVDDYVIDILKEFDAKVKNWERDIAIKGKNLQVANVEQASLLARYDQIRVDLRSLLNYYDMKVKQVRSECLKFIHEHSTYDHNASEKDKMIDSDPKYLKYKRIYLEVQEMYDLLTSISEQFKNRAYTLHNLVKIHVASLGDITLYEDD